MNCDSGVDNSMFKMTNCLEVKYTRLSFLSESQRWQVAQLRWKIKNVSKTELLKCNQKLLKDNEPLGSAIATSREAEKASLQHSLKDHGTIQRKEGIVHRVMEQNLIDNMRKNILTEFQRGKN